MEGYRYNLNINGKLESGSDQEIAALEEIIESCFGDSGSLHITNKSPFEFYIDFNDSNGRWQEAEIDLLNSFAEKFNKNLDILSAEWEGAEGKGIAYCRSGEWKYLKSVELCKASIHDIFNELQSRIDNSAYYNQTLFGSNELEEQQIKEALQYIKMINITPVSGDNDEYAVPHPRI